MSLLGKSATADNTEFVASVLTHFRPNALRALHKLWERCGSLKKR